MNVHAPERIASCWRRPATPEAATPGTGSGVQHLRGSREHPFRLYGNFGTSRPVKGSRPGMQIAVGGCLAEKDQATIVDRAPWVDVVFGTHNIGAQPA